MGKVHIHSGQFDGAMHSSCGRGNSAVTEAEFEATPASLRCRLCDRYRFPNGQPEWHYQMAMKEFDEVQAMKGGA